MRKPQNKPYKRTRGQDLSQGLDVAFSFTCLAAFGGIQVVIFLARNGTATPVLVGVSFATLLTCAIIGVAAKGDVEQLHRASLARVYGQALQGFRSQVEDRRRNGGASATRAIGGLAKGFAQSLRVALLGRDELRRWAVAMHDEVKVRAEAAAHLAASMSSDIHAITGAGIALREAETKLAADINEAKRRVEAVADAVEQIALALTLGHRPDLTSTQNRLRELRIIVHGLMPRSGAGQDTPNEASRAVERLPGYSDAMADIMRGLPQVRSLA